MLFTVLISIKAQEMSVKSFESLSNDLIARTKPIYDINGMPCAVIRVGIALQGVVFDGNVIGNSFYNTGEYIVYISAGSKKLTIRHDNYLPLDISFADYGIDYVESLCTYRLMILTDANTMLKQQSQGNFLVMTVSPSSSRVLIDNEESSMTDSEGIFKIYLKNGLHSYRVEAGNAYTPVSGTIEMKGDRITLPISLKSLKSSLFIKSKTSDAKIYVNEDYKGIGQWSGELIPGTYLIEVKKEGYRSFSTTVSLGKQQSETIAVPVLQVAYGSLCVDYLPVDADVYLDNRLLGKTPNVFNNIPVGKHEIKIRKTNYADFSDSMRIQDNKQKYISGNLILDSLSSNTVVSIAVNGVSFNMIKVDGGTFTMGATSEQNNPFSDETPTHPVTLSSYYIGESEVTQALWKAVLRKNPSCFKGDDLPVENVSWNDCQNFILKLNELTNKKFRLPTEAEWEFAARGGNKSNHTRYSGDNNVDNVAWYDINSGSRTHPVMNKKANELGIYDMSGNVREWCQDIYGSYRSTIQNNPIGPDTGINRVNRGGCWGYDAWFCRSAIRSYSAPDYCFSHIGLRLVLSE